MTCTKHDSKHKWQMEAKQYILNWKKNTKQPVRQDGNGINGRNDKTCRDARHWSSDTRGQLARPTVKIETGASPVH